MPAWKQQLRRNAAGEGHRLTPIVRSTPKFKGKTLAAQPNSYDTRCEHCTLCVEASTYPGFQVTLKYKLRSEPIHGMSPCTPARYKAASTRFFNREQAATQQEAGSDAAA